MSFVYSAVNRNGQMPPVHGPGKILFIHFLGFRAAEAATQTTNLHFRGDVGHVLELGRQLLGIHFVSEEVMRPSGQ